MSAFLKLKDCDIISTYYKTYPSQTGIVLNEGTSSNDFISKQYYLETEENFEFGTERNLFDVEGAYITGSYNLSGTITLLKDAALTNLEKRTVNRLRNIYADVSFQRPQSYISSSVFSASTPPGQYMTVISVPSVLFGSEIKPGSFKLSVSGSNRDLTLTDDSYGGILSSSILIGSIFYQHGIVMLGHHSEAFENDFESSVIHFSGTSTIPMTMYVCTAPRGQLNFSQNSSFTTFNSSSNKNEITTKENKTFITGVGLYDEDFNLLGVAKVAKPILNEEANSVQFRLKLSY